MEAKIAFDKIYPVVATPIEAAKLSSNLSIGRLHRPKDWEEEETPENNIVSNVFEDVVTENFGEIYKEETGKEISPTVLHSKQAYQNTRHEKVPIIDRYRKELHDRIWYGFLNNDLKGCYAFMKVPSPMVVGQGLHVGVRYYDPNVGSFQVYPEEKSGQAGSHFWTKYIRRSSKWKVNLEDTLINGFKKCHDKYGFGEIGKSKKSPSKVSSGANPNMAVWVSSGSWYKGRCYTKQQWQKEKDTCKSILVNNFDGDGERAFITIRRGDIPDKDYDSIGMNSMLSIDPSEFECEERLDKRGRITKSCVPKVSKLNIEVY